MAFSRDLATAVISTLIPGLIAGFILALSTQISTVVLLASSAGLTKVTRAATGTSMSAIFISAGSPGFRRADSDCAMCALAITRDRSITVSRGWFAVANSPANWGLSVTTPSMGL